jgi:hypothetical protein
MPRWTPEARQKQRENAIKSKPWGKSTGPRTPDGKRKVSCNGFKHGLRSKEMQTLLRTMAAQSRYVRTILRHKKEMMR